MYISSIQQSNGNSIEFSLLTQTRNSSKMLQFKFLHIVDSMTDGAAGETKDR